MNSLHECRSSVTGLHESCGTAEPHNNDLSLCVAAEVTTATTRSTTVPTHSGRDVPSGARCFRLLRYCPATEKVHEGACSNNHDGTITSEKIPSSSCSCAPQLTTLSLGALSPVTGPDEHTAGTSGNSGAVGTSSVHSVYALLTLPTRPLAVTEMNRDDYTKGVALPLTHDPLCPFSPQEVYDTTPTTTSSSTKMTEVASLLWPPAAETQVLVVSPDRLPQSASGSHFDNAGGSLDESSAATVLTSSMVLSSESSMQSTTTATKEGVASVMECAGKATHSASRSPARHDVPGEHRGVQNEQAVWRGEQGVHPHHNNLHEGNSNTSSGCMECAGNSSSKPVLRFPAQIGVAMPLSDAVMPGAKGGVAVRSMWSSAPRSGPRRKTTITAANHSCTSIAIGATRLGKPGSVEVTQSRDAASVQPAVVNNGPGDDNPSVTTKRLSPLLHCRLATPSSPSSAAVLGWKAPSPASIASPRETQQNSSVLALHRRMEDNNNNNKECVALSLDEHDEKSVQTLREGSSPRLKGSRVPTLCTASAAHSSPRRVCSAAGATEHTDPQPESMNSVASSPRLATVTSPPRKEETHHLINAAAPLQQPLPVLPKATLSLALAVDISKRSGNVRTLLTHYMNYERELLWQRLCEHHPCLAPLSSFSTARNGQLLSLSLRASLLRLYFQSFHDAMRRLRVRAGMSALVAAQRFASGAALRAAALAHATHACTDVRHNTTALSRNVFPGAIATQQTMNEGFVQVPPAVKGLEHVFSDLLCRNVSDAADDTSRTPHAPAAVCAGQSPSPLLLSEGNGAESVAVQPATTNATMLLNLQELRRYVKLDAEYFASQDNTSNALSSAGVERRLSEQDSLRLAQLRELQRCYGALRAQSTFLQRYLPEYIDTTRLVRWLRATGDDMGTTVKVMQHEMWTNAHEITAATSAATTNVSKGTIPDVEVMPQQGASRTNVTQSTTTTTTTNVMTPEVREQLRRCVMQMERDEESMQWSVGLEEAIRKRRLCPEAALDLIHCLEDDPNTVVQLWYSAEGEVMNMFRLLLYTLRPRAAK